jgi:hypothetical protein
MSAAILTFEQVKEVVENLDEVRQLIEEYHQWLLSTGYSNTIDCHCFIPNNQSLFSRIIPKPKPKNIFQRLFCTEIDAEERFFYPRNIPEGKIPYKNFTVKIKQEKQEEYKDLHIWFIYLPQTKEMRYFSSYKQLVIAYDGTTRAST